MSEATDGWRHLQPPNLITEENPKKSTKGETGGLFRNSQKNYKRKNQLNYDSSFRKRAHDFEIGVESLKQEIEAYSKYLQKMSKIQRREPEATAAVKVESSEAFNQNSMAVMHTPSVKVKVGKMVPTLKPTLVCSAGGCNFTCKYQKYMRDHEFNVHGKEPVKDSVDASINVSSIEDDLTPSKSREVAKVHNLMENCPHSTLNMGANTSQDGGSLTYNRRMRGHSSDEDDEEEGADKNKSRDEDIDDEEEDVQSQSPAAIERRRKQAETKQALHHKKKKHLAVLNSDSNDGNGSQEDNKADTSVSLLALDETAATPIDSLDQTNLVKELEKAKTLRKEALNQADASQRLAKSCDQRIRGESILLKKQTNCNNRDCHDEKQCRRSLSNKLENKAKTNCNFFMRGHCNKPKNCPFQHDPEARDRQNGNRPNEGNNSNNTVLGSVAAAPSGHQQQQPPTNNTTRSDQGQSRRYGRRKGRGDNQGNQGGDRKEEIGQTFMSGQVVSGAGLPSNTPPRVPLPWPLATSLNRSKLSNSQHSRAASLILLSSDSWGLSTSTSSSKETPASILAFPNYQLFFVMRLNTVYVRLSSFTQCLPNLPKLCFKS